jgi:hypothetical protein
MVLVRPLSPLQRLDPWISLFMILLWGKGIRPVIRHTIEESKGIPWPYQPVLGPCQKGGKLYGSKDGLVSYPSCDKTYSALLGTKPVEGLVLNQSTWAKSESNLRLYLVSLVQQNILWLLLAWKTK